MEKNKYDDDYYCQCKSKALRRLQVNFGFFKSFTTNNDNNETKSFYRNENERSSTKRKTIDNTNSTFNITDNLNNNLHQPSIIIKDHNKFCKEITLNRPKKLNSLDLPMILTIKSELEKLIDNSTEKNQSNTFPNILLLTGSGRSFSSGGDISSFYTWKREDPKFVKKGMQFLTEEYNINLLIPQIQPISIVIWDGIVLGEGVGLSIHCNIRIATENTIFGMPQPEIGLFSNVGGSFFLSRIYGNREQVGLFCGLTGHRLKGYELIETGIATHYIHSIYLEGLKKALVKKSEKLKNLENVYEFLKRYTDVVSNPAKFFFKNEQFINKIFKFDSIEQILERLKEFIEEGKDEQRHWAKEVLKNLGANSLISLVVILELMKRGRGFENLKEAAEFELKLCKRFLEGSDFYEGIRAKIVDRDNNPKWKYNSLKECSEDLIIKDYFE